MPSLSFKRQFIPAIKAGLEVRAFGRDPYPGEACKLQTIRARGKRPYKVGDTLYLGVGMRTSSYERIGTATCREVTPIDIDPYRLEVRMPSGSTWLDLSPDEVHALALADGFAHSGEFFQFFSDNYPGGTFSGQLIKW